MTIEVTDPAIAHIQRLLEQELGAVRVLAYLEGFMRVGLEREQPGLTLTQTRELCDVIAEHINRKYFGA